MGQNCVSVQTSPIHSGPLNNLRLITKPPTLARASMDTSLLAPHLRTCLPRSTPSFVPVMQFLHVNTCPSRRSSNPHRLSTISFPLTTSCPACFPHTVRVPSPCQPGAPSLPRRLPPYHLCLPEPSQPEHAIKARNMLGLTDSSSPTQPPTHPHHQLHLRLQGPPNFHKAFCRLPSSLQPCPANPVAPVTLARRRGLGSLAPTPSEHSLTHRCARTYPCRRPYRNTPHHPCRTSRPVVAHKRGEVIRSTLYPHTKMTTPVVARLTFGDHHHV